MLQKYFMWEKVTLMNKGQNKYKDFSKQTPCSGKNFYIDLLTTKIE